MSSPERAPRLIEAELNEVAELARPLDLAKWAADNDREVSSGPRALGIPRGFVLLGLALAGWAVVIGVVLLVRAVFLGL